MPDMQIVDRLTAIVRTIEYKPNWILDVVPITEGHRVPGAAALRMAFYTRNADYPTDPDRQVKIGRSRPFPPIVYTQMQDESFESFVTAWVKQQIRDLELHEADEWFRVRGTRWPTGAHPASPLTP